MLFARRWARCNRNTVKTRVADIHFWSKAGRLAMSMASVGFGLIVSPVQAAVEVVTLAESAIPANYADREIQIKQFDPSLGTLKSVWIDVQATGTFTQLFENVGQSAGNLVIQQRLQMVLEAADDKKLIALTQVENHTYGLSAF